MAQEHLPFSVRTTTVTVASATPGPFELDFPLFGDDDLFVQVNGNHVTNFSVSADYVDGRDDNSSITFFDDLNAGDKIQIIGHTDPDRKRDIAPGSPQLIKQIDSEVSRIFAILQEQARDARRSIRFAGDADELEPIEDIEEGQAIIRLAGGFGAGPNAEDIANAQENAASARASAELSIAASEDAVQAANLAFQTASRSPLTPEDFDAPTDPVNFADMTGPDHTAAIQAMILACVETGRPGLLRNRYRHEGPLIMPEGVVLYGQHSNRSGILLEMENTHSGLEIAIGNNHIRDLELMGWLQQPKIDSHSGHKGATILAGDYMTGDLGPSPRGCTFDRVKLSRAPGTTGTPSYEAIGALMAGNASNISFGDMEVVGNHSFGVAAHWSGDANAVGEVVTNTVHPDNLTFRRLIMSGGVKSGAYFSSCSNVTVGEMNIHGAEQALLVLPGDEGADFAGAVRQPQIGQGLRFGAIRATGCIASDKEVVEITSVASSRFRTEEGAMTYKRTLQQDVHIGAVSLETSAADMTGVRVFEMDGAVTIDHLETRGFETASEIIRTSAAVDINVVGADGKVHVDRSPNVRIRGGNVSLEELADADAVCLDFEGTNTSAVLDADVAAGDGSITLVSGFGHDVMPGDPIRVGSETVYALEFAESGREVIPVSDFIRAQTASDPVSLMMQTVASCEISSKGGRTGLRATGARVAVTGAGPKECGRFGYYAGVAGHIDVKGAAPMGVGRAKIPDINPGYSTYCAVAEAKGHINVTGGYWGIGCDDVTAIFDVNLSGSDAGTITVNNARIVDSWPLAAVTPGANFYLNNCTDDEGASISYP